MLTEIIKSAGDTVRTLRMYSLGEKVKTQLRRHAVPFCELWEVARVVSFYCTDCLVRCTIGSASKDL